MRFIFTLVFLIIAVLSYSQKLTGIWRGTFMQREPNPFTGEWETYVYKYEVQINQINPKTIQGVTYSYKQKEFYGKAAFKGLFTKTTKNVLLKETKMLELKTTENSVPCLMTCYLDYSKDGDVEKLKGTFSSIESPGNRNCGGGTISLQRVLHSDFKKENFLVKKPSSETSASSSVHETKPIGENKPATPNKILQNNTIAKNHSSVATSPHTNKLTETIVTTVLPSDPKKVIADTMSKEMVIEKPFAIPLILRERVNKLVNTVFINEKDIIVDYYDNGEIDGDIISVYDNNRLVLDNDTLSTKPLRLNIHCDENNAVHELITVAENLGTIPPNTCLMVITAGKKRIEVPMTSDEKTNAKVIIEYHPREGTKIMVQN